MEGIAVYKFDRERQFSLTDFNQPLGMQMNENNRWVKKAESIPWTTIEDEYAKLFPSKTGMPAKPLRTALGSLIIQKQYGYSDEELVEQLRENPYYQYFIGLPGYEDKIPFVPSLMVEFRKRLDEETLSRINDMIIEYNQSEDDDQNDSDDSDGVDNTAMAESTVSENTGTMIIDATCAPQNIKYPQDIELLNEAREKIEEIIDEICRKYNFYTPRMYRRKARKDYLSIAKSRKRGGKKLRKSIRKQLQYISRDLGYIDMFVKYNDVKLCAEEEELLGIIKKVYEQQKYMYDNKTHTVADRIVSISQPYIRPIVRGKAKSPVEFGAKLDLSVDEAGMARIEKLSFNAYNESEVLKSAAENYKKRTGHYPERILADQIYRTKANIQYCKEKGIRLSGKRLGRPKKNPEADRKTEYKDNVDRIEVERRFSLAKRKYGLDLLLTKREDTTRASIVLSIIAMNVDRIVNTILHQLFLALNLLVGYPTWLGNCCGMRMRAKMVGC